MSQATIITLNGTQPEEAIIRAAVERAAKEGKRCDTNGVRSMATLSATVWAAMAIRRCANIEVAEKVAYFTLFTPAGGIDVLPREGSDLDGSVVIEWNAS